MLNEQAELKIVEAYLDGKAAFNIGKRYGISTPEVCDIVRRYNHRTTPWTSEEVELLVELYPKMPTSEIAERLGKRVPVILNKARTLRLRKDSAVKAETARKVYADRQRQAPDAMAAFCGGSSGWAWLKKTYKSNN